MAKGSFERLYTFLEVAKIYGIDDSYLRKQVARGKFVIGKDVKKMGRTWIITEQTMVKTFGKLKFEGYKNSLKKKEKVVRSKGSKSNNKVLSMNEKEEKIKDSWISNKINGIELKSFAFNTNDNEWINIKVRTS